MSGALYSGLFGKMRASLAPSIAAIGPNTYLGRNDFLKMLAAAFLFHVVVFWISSLFPNKEVLDIPVRALSFKLGDQDRVAAYGMPAPAVAAAAPPAPAMEATAAVPEFVEAPTERVAPKMVKPVPQPKPQPRMVPKEQYTPEPVPQAQPKPEPIAPLPYIPPSAPAIAPQPQQYVREVGQALAPLPVATVPVGVAKGAVGGQGTENTQTQQTAEAIRERYEQQISGWIQRHKIYPAGAAGAYGRVVVRMRIDRAGAVRYYALEQSSGNNIIDAAAVDMVRRANPVPAVPANYPAGNLIEFLIPITFEAPK
jgi:protein TonB